MIFFLFLSTPVSLINLQYAIVSLSACRWLHGYPLVASAGKLSLASQTQRGPYIFLHKTTIPGQRNDWIQKTEVWYQCVITNLPSPCRKHAEPDVPSLLRVQWGHQSTCLLDERREVYWGHGPESHSREWNQVRRNTMEARVNMFCCKKNL